MDDTIAAKLTELFKDKSWKHPIDTKLFEVFFSNRTGTDMKFKLSTPDELSSVLKHIIDNADGDLFNRASNFGAPDPLHVRMTIRTRDAQNENKEHIRQAFVMVFRDIEDPSYVYWQPTPDRGYNGPGLSDFIHILDQSQNDWENMNFIRSLGRPQLKLVHSRP
jgi:hypothetical protein